MGVVFVEILDVYYLLHALREFACIAKFNSIMSVFGCELATGGSHSHRLRQ